MMRLYRCQKGHEMELDDSRTLDPRYLFKVHCWMCGKKTNWTLVQSPPPSDPVTEASDRIEPRVHDNEFSREALDKVLHSGRDKSMRRTMLRDLYEEPDGLSSSQFESRYGWLHQSASAALNGLEKAGLVDVTKERVNRRGNREGVYRLTPMTRGAMVPPVNE